jgi:hypothetical protein
MKIVDVSLGEAGSLDLFGRGDSNCFSIRSLGERIDGLRSEVSNLRNDMTALRVKTTP